jgi:hypothetical protein
MIVEFARRKLAVAGRKAAVLVALGLSALVGGGFLIAAGWTALADHFGSAAASAVVGVILLTPVAGVGLAYIFRRVREKPEPRPLQSTIQSVTLPEVMLAFTLATRLGETLVRLRRKADRASEHRDRATNPD